MPEFDMHTVVYNIVSILSLYIATAVAQSNVSFKRNMYMTCKSILLSDMHVSKLTDDCLSFVFQWLDNRDRRSCSLVCRRWLHVECKSRQSLSLEANDDFVLFGPRVFSRSDFVTRVVLRYPDYEVQTLDYDKVLSFVSAKCPNLRCLKLRGGCCQVGEVGMASLGMNATRLRRFSCWDRVLGAQAMNALLRHSSSLEEISVKHGLKGGSEVVEPGATANSLKYICLKDFDDSEHVQSFGPLISGSRNLRSLKLLRCQGDWDTILNMVRNGKNNLIEIYLDELDVSDVGLSALWYCWKLQILHLGRIRNCTDTGIVSVVKQCRLLRKIYVDESKRKRVNDALARMGRHHVKLQVIK